MKPPTVALLRSLRSASGRKCDLCAAAQSRRISSTASKDAAAHSYSSAWRRSRNPRARSVDGKSSLDKYFDDLVSQPAPKVTPATSTPPTPPPPDVLPKTSKEDTLSKARVVFGSRLAGPAERRREVEARSTMIAGILVPPRPSEPDNCCMSGCVNCVWDLYREELEEWASKSAAARERIASQRKTEARSTGRHDASVEMPSHVANSMDDDGGGSDTNWSTGPETSAGKGDLFEGIPIGIREFMKQEKRLKDRKMKVA